MGFTSRNQFSQQTMDISSRMKAVSKGPHSQSKNDLAFKEADLDQADQKDIRNQSSQKMIKLNKNDQKKGFTSRNQSSHRPKEVSPGMKAVPKYRSPHSQLENNLRVKEAGSKPAQPKRSAVNIPKLELKGLDVEDQINFIDRLSEDSDYMWLSSESLSSSLLGSDDSQDVWEFDYLNLFLQGQFSSVSSLSGSSAFSSDKGNESFVSDGSRSSPISEICSVLSRQLGLGGKDMATPTQQGTLGNKDSSVAHSESPSSSQRTLSDAPSSDDSSFALPSTYLDMPSWDFIRTDIWVSSLDLETEDSELIWDRKDDLAIFESDFPSPSSSGMQHQQIHNFSSSCLNYIGQTDKVQSLDSDSDEPLFWPFHHNLYGCLDLEKFLCSSPRKNESKVGVAKVNGSKSTRLKIPEKKPQANRNDTQRLGRRISPTLTPKLVSTKCETGGVDYGASSTPSRLIRSTKAPAQQHLCNISKRRGRP